jgi:hypothetical protein
MKSFHLHIRLIFFYYHLGSKINGKKGLVYQNRPRSDQACGPTLPPARSGDIGTLHSFRSSLLDQWVTPVGLTRLLQTPLRFHFCALHRCQPVVPSPLRAASTSTACGSPPPLPDFPRSRTMGKRWCSSLRSRTAKGPLLRPHILLRPLPVLLLLVVENVRRFG